MGQGKGVMWAMMLSRSLNSKLPRAGGTSPKREKLGLVQSWKVTCERRDEPVRCAPRGIHILCVIGAVLRARIRVTAS